MIPPCSDRSPRARTLVRAQPSPATRRSARARPRADGSGHGGRSPSRGSAPPPPLQGTTNPDGGDTRALKDCAAEYRESKCDEAAEVREKLVRSDPQETQHPAQAWRLLSEARAGEYA